MSSTYSVHFNDWVTKCTDTRRTVNREALLLGGIFPQDPEKAASAFRCVGTQYAWLVVGVFNLASGNRVI